MRVRARRTLRRAALGLAALVAACAAWRAGAVEIAPGDVVEATAPALDPAEARIADAAADGTDRAGSARSAGAGGATLTAARPDGPETFLATAGITLEPVSEREGPQVRMRVRGLRVIRGARPLRLALNPDAPQARCRELAHLDSLPALVQARAGILPSRGTSRPPPSHSS